MSPAFDAYSAEKRAAAREQDPDLARLKPGEEHVFNEDNYHFGVFRCEHCRKLRSFKEGCDTGHALVTDPAEDVYLRSVCDYCWGTITSALESIHYKPRSR